MPHYFRITSKFLPAKGILIPWQWSFGKQAKEIQNLEKKSVCSFYKIGECLLDGTNMDKEIDNLK